MNNLKIQTTMNYDIIGDIHGHADTLEKLLQKLGYQLQNGIYSHPERKVLFLGDFIDRGPKIRETLHIAKNMCDSGNAYAIMGNHEFNAICFHEPDLKNGGFYRKHSFKKINQHLETLKQFQGFEKELKDFIKWFRTLPLFLEFENFNCVHAYWDQKQIDWFKNKYTNFKYLTNEFLTLFSDDQSLEHTFIEETLKGKEYQLPEGVSFNDKDGQNRDKCRLTWWQPKDKRTYYKDILQLCPSNFGNKKVTETNLFINSPNKPTFFGHYWLKGEPSIENNKAICLDYSVAKKGKLVAYRFNNEKVLSNENLIYV